MKNFKTNNKGLIGVLFLGLIVLAVIAGSIVTYSSQVQTYTVTGVVKDVKLVPTGEKDNPTTYVVWLADGQKLEIKRNFFNGDNEDDIYQELSSNINSSYVFTCWGWQLDNRMLGTYWYPNIAHVERVQ
jgi:hypothetical protein